MTKHEHHAAGIPSAEANRNNLERTQTMNDTTSVTKDPICGMTVDPKTALHAERDGASSYFCGEHCREKFLSTPVGAQPQAKSGGCCK